MVRTAFLASKYLSGLSHVLPAEPADLRTVFVPTAGIAYASAPWIDDDRRWFAVNGFVVEELELATATIADVASSLSGADLVYCAGGNTYVLLQHMQRTEFWRPLEGVDPVYSGASAGAIVACPDIAYIDDIDDGSQTPGLTDTTGAGLVDVSIMPHMDDESARPAIDRILSGWPDHARLVTLNDDQAVVIADGHWRIVDSPDTGLEPR